MQLLLGHDLNIQMLFNDNALYGDIIGMGFYIVTINHQSGFYQMTINQGFIE
jgi:hypothetical protein